MDRSDAPTAVVRLATARALAFAAAAAVALAAGRLALAARRPARRAAPRRDAGGRAVHLRRLQLACPPADRWLSAAEGPTRRGARWPSTSTTGTGSAGRTASPAPRPPQRQASSRRGERRALQLHAAGRRRRPRHATTGGAGVALRASPRLRRRRAPGPALVLTREGNRGGPRRSRRPARPAGSAQFAGYWAVARGRTPQPRRGRRERTARRSGTTTWSPAVPGRVAAWRHAGQ